MFPFSVSKPVPVTQEVLDAVGKVLAVHLSYSSRAAQRGRTPKFPSYFMKATSSLALSGAEVERPADTELLQFEGEIALVIGTEARRITPEQGWAHVGWVTASNDLGIQDIKYADKGSNVRSKSGDGYTPLGPVLLPASELDPERLRVTTRLNGAEVQNATTDELLFSFGQIVADLSQQMTLHPGDVILTGTPAGSSVFAPGDTVTIEVSDAREAGASTGELTTTATQANQGFKAFGNPTKVTDADRIDAWGDAESAGIAPAENPLTPEVRAQLEAAAVATLSTSVKKAGVENCTIAGLTATKGTRRVIGVARTLRYVPLRQDLFKQSGGGYNAQKRVIDSLNEGEILVMEARGETGAATMGDILVTRAGVKGAAGIISDGAVRDLSAVTDIDLPVFHSGAHPSVLGRKHIPWDTDITVACGGATVQPGDVIVADSDGIIVIPPALVAQVAADAAAQEAQDAWVLEQVEAGNAIEGLFPPSGEWKAKYEAYKAEQGEN
ncbi:fumarylacetoacetate hydrolase family protein [Galactobacter sp.]|uniref:fumarylacetoacetate hydrolase family protein n=1 Tax=Galactobacter sp. TaxID=2676125 RepID=UPI0025BCFC8A|nr:fumarylacetoacetate hydrolase family protein [Galactobacter sp.]